MKILFTVSVLLNVLLLGGHVGMLIKRSYDNPWHRAYSDLKPETQNLVAREFQEARKNMPDTRNEFRAARKEITRILKQDTLDEQAYEAAIKRMQAAQQKMMDSKMEMMKNIMSQLPPDEREKLSHRLMRPFGKSHMRYGPHRPDEDKKTEAE